jgi:hypothetical protein
MVIFLFVRSFYNYTCAHQTLKSHHTNENNNNKLQKRSSTTINTFSQESLHISIKAFVRDATTCVMLLLLDYIARTEIDQKDVFGDNILERKSIFV